MDDDANPAHRLFIQLLIALTLAVTPNVGGPEKETARGAGSGVKIVWEDRSRSKLSTWSPDAPV
jgi:hypothetical protein